MARKFLCVLLLGLACVWAGDAGAQEASSTPDGEWGFTASPYLLAPSMDGAVGIRGIDVDVDASAGDIFGNLRFGFMLYLEAGKGDWAFSIDTLYMDLAQDAAMLPLEVGSQQTAVMLSVYRRVSPWAEIYAGGRLNRISGQLRSTREPRLIDLDQSETWFDPYVGLRLALPDTGRWQLGLRGDVGGFSVGSKLAWQIEPRVEYRISGLVRIHGAYRWLDMDYEADDRAFRYDIMTSGSQLGVAFTF